MSLTAATYVVSVGFWLLTAIYGVLSSQAFIQEQFLQPRLFAPIAVFSDWHPAIGLLTLAAWGTARWRMFGRPLSVRHCIAGVAWLGAIVVLVLSAPLSPALSPNEALLVIGSGVLLILTIALAEYRVLPDAREHATGDRSLADLTACLLAALAVTIAHVAAAAWVEPSGDLVSDAVGSLRLHLLLAAGGFLVLSAVRAIAALTPSPVATEALLSVVVLASGLTAFTTSVVLTSISLRGPVAVGIGLGLGTSLACAIGAYSTVTGAAHDGIPSVFSALTPKVVTRWWGVALWMTGFAALVALTATASRHMDWNFLLLRTGVVVSWILALSAALTCTRRLPDGGTAAAFSSVALILGAHVGLQLSVAPVQAATHTNASARWLAEIVAGDQHTTSARDVVRFLHAHTNIPRSTPVAAVDVDLAPLHGDPAAVRPHVFVLIIDSLRRDYLAPYNPAVTFTPAIAALAEDSLVFRNAFTQYGATGLSVPSIWVGGPILHKQYVSSFPRMNTLAKLLTHERYESWLSVDHIVDTITPPSVKNAPLNAGVLVKHYRTCATLDEIRSRLAQRLPADAPVFAYALPQDVHVSVIASEGAQSVDQNDYQGFYAPVASRVRRLDRCIGEFIADLKARGLYDQSVIVLTSDHGDSLGEDGRMGHAYSLHPEVVRIPLIVHLPSAMRHAWSWHENRAAYSTDITPTLYRLLGHEPSSPASFFGESLAQSPGAPPPPQRDRMIAASYGAVYGALLANASRYYVFDAVGMREMAFETGKEGGPGTEVPVTPDVRDRGLAVIRDSVGAIGSFYRFTTAPDSAP